MRQTVRRGTGSRQQPHCPAPRRGSELADGCNSDDKQTVCGGDQPSHRVLEMNTGEMEVLSLHCGNQDEAWGM